jgi:hypothetical protein
VVHSVLCFTFRTVVDCGDNYPGLLRCERVTVTAWHEQKLLAGENRPVFVGCPTGDVVLGGGYHESADYPISDSTPNGRFDGWIVNASGGESTSSGNEVKVYAACAPAK